jgi:hypothetical protein
VGRGASGHESASFQLSELPPLSGDIDFGVLGADEHLDTGAWTPVTRWTACTVAAKKHVLKLFGRIY